MRDLVVAYPANDGWREVVKGVSLSLRRGEVLGLVGESGSGKSQTAFAILGLLSPGGRILSGSIRFDGIDLGKPSGDEVRALRGKRIAYVPQEPMANLDPAFRIGFQLVEPMMTVLGISGGGDAAGAETACPREAAGPGTGVSRLSARDLRVAWRSASSLPVRSPAVPTF
ncbi:ATP-binding cassette domain-containing protein (plasmid) [Neorhizobium galegae]|nr:ATP-binding cassette domain-containing protein [Neorhizobium galegae]